MPTRITGIFQFRTAPDDKARATEHIAGWTESFWTTLQGRIQEDATNAFFSARALLMPSTGSIIGYRVAEYEIQKNRLLPKGAFSISKYFPGGSIGQPDVPQMALNIQLYAADGNNVSRPWLRGIPDVMVNGGEYQPMPAYQRNLSTYFRAASLPGVGFVARDLSLGQVRVNSLAAGVLSADGLIPGVGVGDYVRFSRVYDNVNRPVIGAFQVKAIGAFTYTLDPAPDHTVDKPSGLVRKDEIKFHQTITPSYHRIGVKKVGRPSEGYRGRRSRKRA